MKELVLAWMQRAREADKRGDLKNSIKINASSLLICIRAKNIPLSKSVKWWGFLNQPYINMWMSIGVLIWKLNNGFKRIFSQDSKGDLISDCAFLGVLPHDPYIIW